MNHTKKKMKNYAKIGLQTGHICITTSHNDHGIKDYDTEGQLYNKYI